MLTPLHSAAAPSVSVGFASPSALPSTPAALSSPRHPGQSFTPATAQCRAAPPSTGGGSVALAGLVAKLGSPLATGDPLLDSLAALGGSDAKSADGAIASVNVSRIQKTQEEAKHLSLLLEVSRERREQGSWDKLIRGFEIAAAVIAGVSTAGALAPASIVAASLVVASMVTGGAAGVTAGLLKGTKALTVDRQLNGHNLQAAQTDKRVEQTQKDIDEAKALAQEHFDREQRVAGCLRSCLESRETAKRASITA